MTNDRVMIDRVDEWNECWVTNDRVRIDRVDEWNEY